MELNFANGTELQKAACRTAAHNLLNLPFNAIPLILNIEFVKDPAPELHNEFAYTEWTWGGNEAEVRIASIAPNWAEPWRGVRFLQEVFAHELAHALYASLPEESRIAIAQMFGLKSADPDELAPEGARWENRVMEGIAETIKDAFLPLRFRRYANRTNRRISISQYPEFRRLIRKGLEGASAFEQMQNLPTIDVFETLENPLGAPYVLWPPAEHIGRVWGNDSPTIGYSAPVASGNPRVVSALYTAKVFSGRFGVTVRKRNTWEVNDPEPGNRAGQYYAYACASAEGGGRGYKLVATQVVNTLNPEPDIFNVRLERWKSGALDEVLFEKGDIPIVSFIFDDTRRDFGLSVFDGRIGIWVPEGLSAPGIIEIGSVEDDTFTSGFVGLGVRRENRPTPQATSFPQLGRFRAGPLFQQAVTVPPGEVGTNGIRTGRVPARQQIRG